MQDFSCDMFIPWDIHLAQECFDANCGPISFAVSVKEEVTDMMRFFPRFPIQGYTTLKDIRRACKMYGVENKVLHGELPHRGLALVQWLGPWMKNDFHGKRSAKHTHWIAIDGDRCFDFNDSRWMDLDDWKSFFAVEFLEEIPGATGWTIKYGVEIYNPSANWPMGPARSVTSAVVSSLSKYFG